MSNHSLFKTSALRGPKPRWLGGRRNPLPQYVPRMLFRSNAAALPGDVLVCVFLRGGMDGMSAVCPYGEGAAYYDARPTIGIPEPGVGEGRAIDLDGFFGLNPAMAAMKPLYDAKSLLVVHATGGTDPTRSHFDAQRYMEQGVPGDKTVQTGWLGRHLHATVGADPSLFRAIGFSNLLPASLRGPEPALAIPSLDSSGLEVDDKDNHAFRDLLAQLYGGDDATDLLRRPATSLFQTLTTLEALVETGYTPSNGATYPEDDFGFGVGLRQTAQLIKAGLGLEVACLDLGGWDTHETEGVLDGYYANIAGALAQGLAAFAADMGAGMDNVTVVTMSEFGRRLEENASAGTDHGHGNVMFMLGGGVKGGRVFTQWPTLQPDKLDDGDLAITTDYIDVLAEVVSNRLGDPMLDYVFPGHTVTPLGLVVPRT